MKKILFITSHDLNARDYGSVLRVRNIARILARHGEVRVILGSRFHEVLQKAKSSQGGFELSAKVQFWPGWYSLPGRIWAGLKPGFLALENYQARLEDKSMLQTLMAQQDLVWIHGLETANAFGIWRWPTSVLDIDDIPSSVYRLRLAQSNSFPDKCFNWKQMLLWRRNEKSLSRRFDAVCVCSEPDKEKLGGDNVFVLPNGFKLPESPPARHPVTPPQIGFVGTFVYWANCQAIEWFVQNVWPLILTRFPEARLRIAGERGENLFKGPNIDALGWVPNMESEMANWSMAIIPVLAGGGTRIKILEAFSRKCPVVSTSIGCYGYGLEHERELLIANTPEEFATSCLRLLDDPTTGLRLTENAWSQFSTNWTWEAQSDRIAEIIAKVCGTPAQPDETDPVSAWKLVPKTIST